MKFPKMQGAGNDYVVIHTDDNERDWGKFAVATCNRYFGIGADSLLLVMPSDKADFRMRIFNDDGSEAEACGNGIRCLAKYTYEKGLTDKSTDTILVETQAGLRDLKLFKDGDKLTSIQSKLGKPIFTPEEIPADFSRGNGKVVYIKQLSCYKTTVDGVNLELNLVSMGNPHAIFFIDESVVDFPLKTIGPKVEHMDIFPNRTNFEVARVIDRNRIEVRTWERGVGETLACGTGACAVCSAATTLEYIDGKADIMERGGTLTAEWYGEGEVKLGGPAEIVFEGQWPD